MNPESKNSGTHVGTLFESKDNKNFFGYDPKLVFSRKF